MIKNKGFIPGLSINQKGAHELLKKLIYLTVGCVFLFCSGSPQADEEYHQPPSVYLNENSEGFCNWGFAGPKQFQCNGKIYIHGSTFCQNRFYQDIFCEEKYAPSGFNCMNDNSPNTIACYHLCRQNGLCK